MPELMSIKELPREIKIALLKELDYDSDGIHVLDSEGKIHLDRYTHEPVKLDNMLILSGSTIIIDNNPLSITSFLEEYGDVLG
ncbi:MAG: hypothetical protein HY518_00275, partial [Candidatus Aenigmarchaeota archaeon]|nr:hypothetical protein [Candidatus Aenigmarchaeota archaeon]